MKRVCKNAYIAHFYTLSVYGTVSEKYISLQTEKIETQTQ